MDKLIEGFYVIPNADNPDQQSLWDGMIHATRDDAEKGLDAARPDWGQDAENYHAVALVPAELADALQQLENLGLSKLDAVVRLQQAAMLAVSAAPADAVVWICKVSASGSFIYDTGTGEIQAALFNGEPTPAPSMGPAWAEWSPRLTDLTMPAPTYHEAFEAGWVSRAQARAALQMTAKLLPAAVLGPDCRDGKCAACRGDALDEHTDEIVPCGCSCHTRSTS